MKSYRPASILKAALLLAVALRMVCLASFHEAGDNDLGVAPGLSGWHAAAAPADSCPACRFDSLLVGPPSVAPPIETPGATRATPALLQDSRQSRTQPPGVGRAPPLA